MICICSFSLLCELNSLFVLRFLTGLNFTNKSSKFLGKRIKLQCLHSIYQLSENVFRNSKTKVEYVVTNWSVSESYLLNQF